MREHRPARLDRHLRAGDPRRRRGHQQGPATLHTPLMSGANSIHGIVLVGAMIIAATRDRPARLRARVRRPSSSAPRTSWAATWSPTGCSRCSRRSPRHPRPTRPRRPEPCPRSSLDTIVIFSPGWRPSGVRHRPALHEQPRHRAHGQPPLGGRHGRRGHRHVRLPAAAAGRPLDRGPHRHHRGRLRSSAAPSACCSPCVTHDRDAPAGVAVQRGGRRRGRARRDRGLSSTSSARRRRTSRRRSSWSSACSSAASPSRARSSPRASSRASSPASPSRSPAAADDRGVLGLVGVVGTIVLVLSAGESPVLDIGSEVKTLLPARHLRGRR